MVVDEAEMIGQFLSVDLEIGRLGNSVKEDCHIVMTSIDTTDSSTQGCGEDVACNACQRLQSCHRVYL